MNLPHSPTESSVLEIVEENVITPAMDLAIRKLLCECFPGDAATFSRTRHWHHSAPVFSLIHCRRDAVVGHIGIVLRRVSFGNQPVDIAGIQNLAVRHDFRGTGLSRRLMIESMSEALRRGATHGLLFCVPGLAGFYQSLGWFVVSRRASMMDEHSHSVLTPDKNICMAKNLAGTPLPAGEIHLEGPDW